MKYYYQQTVTRKENQLHPDVDVPDLISLYMYANYLHSGKCEQIVKNYTDLTKRTTFVFPTEANRDEFLADRKVVFSIEEVRDTCAAFDLTFEEDTFVIEDQ